MTPARRAVRCPRPGALLPLTFAAAVSCDGPVEPPDPRPSVSEVRIEEEAGPIFRTLHVRTDRETALEVEYRAEGATPLRVRSDGATDHRIFLSRLRPRTTYDYRISLEGEGPRGELWTGRFTTGALPSALDGMAFTAAGTPTTPLVLLVISRAEGFNGYVAVDADGEVVWYREVVGASGITRRANGNFVHIQDRGLVEVPPRGEVVAELLTDSIARRFHHDVIPTPRNTLLAIATDTQTVRGRRITGKSIWEWTPESGQAQKRWSSFDFLDPDSDRGILFGERNWMHANSLFLGPRGNVLLSSNYLNQVMSIAPDFGSLEWRLSGPNSTIQVPDSERFSGQHTAAEVAPGRILLFDNRREQGGYSRAVEFELGDAEATRVWEWRPERTNFSFAVSSARRLPGGTTLVTFGLAAGVAGSTGPTEVYEVTREGEVLWHLEVEGISVLYRGEPLADIAGEAAAAGSG
ncbi:MAG TPA: aryl-sulfate sulfotransferase [Longimicrobiaceae bacterium]|nr:aryl-sulfate sulfotransferase [Longimicrobiaceae bacterium]